MSIPWMVALGAGIVVVCLNLVGTMRLWRSPVYDPVQKRAQAALIWLLPGFVLVVLHILSDARGSSGGRVEASDPGINSWIINGPNDPPNDHGGGSLGD